MSGTTLGAPAQLLGVRQASEVVQGHHLRVGRQVPVAGAKERIDDLEPPRTRQGRGVQDGQAAATAGAGLGHTLDVLDRTGGHIARAEDAHDRPDRHIRRGLGRLLRPGREEARILHAAGVQREGPAHLLQERATVAHWRCRAQGVVPHPTPRAPVMGSMSKTGRNMPALPKRHRPHGQLYRMQRNSRTTRALVPLNGIPAEITPAALRRPQQPARTVLGNVQGPARPVILPAAIPGKTIVSEGIVRRAHDRRR